jgi:hypothetical protein
LRDRSAAAAATVTGPPQSRVPLSCGGVAVGSGRSSRASLRGSLIGHLLAHAAELGVDLGDVIGLAAEFVVTALDPEAGEVGLAIQCELLPGELERSYSRVTSLELGPD